MKSFAIVLVLIVIFISASSAATNSTTTNTLAIVTNDVASLEVERLKDEIRLLKDFQSDILQTVYWSLGGVFAIAALLVGYNWISANKIYERDKEAVKKEILTGLDGKQQKFESAVRDQLKQNAEKIGSALDLVTEKHSAFIDQISKSITAIEAKFVSFTASSSDALSAYRKEMEDQTRKLILQSVEDVQKHFKAQLDSQVHQIQTKTDEQIKKLSTEIRTLRFELRDVRYDFFEDKATDFETRGDTSLAYTFYFRALEAAIAAGWESFQKKSLDNLIRVLKAGAKLTQSELENSATIPDKAHSSLKTVASEFADLAKKAGLVS